MSRRRQDSLPGRWNNCIELRYFVSKQRRRCLDLEAWLQYRHHCAEFLRTRAQTSGSKSEFMAWEKYVRQTARMQAAAGHLAAALGPTYAVANGLRLNHMGSEIYLEHLVVGPTGIFLLETTEGDNEAWRQDLIRNMDFFQRALGTQSFYFTCLVTCRTIGTSPLPPGAHLVDSLDVAIDVIRDQRSGMTLPLALAQEIWHLIRGVEVSEAPLTRPMPQLPQRRSKWEPIALGLTVLYTLIAATVDGEFAPSIVAGLVMFTLPTFVGLWLIRRIARESSRTGCLIGLLTVVSLLFLIVLAGLTTPE